MRVGIIGYGKMGREVERLCLERGHQVAWRLDERDNPQGQALDDAALAAVDVCFEFTTPSAAVANLQAVVSRGGKVVCGTTGWYADLPVVERAAAPGSGLVWGSNFSVGIYLFRQVVRIASRLASRFPEYDVAVHEVHHAAKVDHPSGTALHLAQVVLEEYRAKRSVVTALGPGRRAPEEVHVSSTRVGHVPGTHRVFLDGPHDTLELVHTARSRAGFAAGALRAAEWLRDKTGIFRFEEVLDAIVEGS